MRPGSVPPVDVLTSLPVATMSGACFASDIRGTGQYIYYFAPTSAAAAQFWRYDTYANSWQRLADPILGTRVFGTGTAIVCDPSGASGTGGAVANPPAVWLFCADAAAPWAALEYYCANNNTWVNIAQAGGRFDAGGLGGAALAAQWSGDAAMVHTCSVLNSTVNDNYLYIGGNNATFFYRYSYAADAVAAMTAHGAVAGAGTTLGWIGQYPDSIYYQRGAGTTTWQRYSIANNAWSNITPLPGTETYTTGTSLIGDMARGKLVTRQGAVAGGLIKMFDYDPLVTSSTTLTPVGNGYLGDGTPHSGALMAMASTGTQKYLYIAKFTSTDFQRVWIIE